MSRRTHLTLGLPIYPAHAQHSLHNIAPHGADEEPKRVKLDRGLMGILAGATLAYLLGQSLGLGQADSAPHNQHADQS